MTLEPWQWGLAFLAAFLVGLSKTGVAGLGILSVALFAMVMPARESVGVVLLVLLAGDVVAVTAYRREASWKHLFRLLPWAAVGIILGAVAFGQMNDRLVRLSIGLLLVALVVFQFLRRRYGTSGVPEQDPGLLFVGSMGIMAGFTTMVANAAGPLMIIYLLAMRLPKLIFVGTAAWFFLTVNLAKVPFSYSLGLINGASAMLSLKLAPFAVLGAVGGRWLIHYIDQDLFETIALLLTLVAGIRLLIV